MPLVWDSIGEEVIVRVTVDDGQDKGVIARDQDFYVEDEYY